MVVSIASKVINRYTRSTGANYGLSNNTSVSSSSIFTTNNQIGQATGGFYNYGGYGAPIQSVYAEPVQPEVNPAHEQTKAENTVTKEERILERQLQAESLNQMELELALKFSEAKKLAESAQKTNNDDKFRELNIEYKALQSEIKGLQTNYESEQAKYKQYAENDNAYKVIQNPNYNQTNYSALGDARKIVQDIEIERLNISQEIQAAIGNDAQILNLMSQDAKLEAQLIAAQEEYQMLAANGMGGQGLLTLDSAGSSTSPVFSSFLNTDLSEANLGPSPSEKAEQAELVAAQQAAQKEQMDQMMAQMQENPMMMMMMMMMMMQGGGMGGMMGGGGMMGAPAATAPQTPGTYNIPGVGAYTFSAMRGGIGKFNSMAPVGGIGF